MEPRTPPGGEGLATILRRALEEDPLRGGVSLGRLYRDWGAVVGPRLGAETSPAALRGGVLTVAATTGGWAAQVRFLAREVARNANRMLGRDGVREVRVVVRPRASKGLRDNHFGGRHRSEEEPPGGTPSDRI